MRRALRLVAAAILIGGLAMGRSATADEPLASPSGAISSAPELFDLFGIDEGLFQRFVVGEPPSESEREPLARVLARLPQIKLGDVERWAKRGVALEDIEQDPGQHQREFFRLEGRIRRVSRESFSPELQDRFAVEHFFRCEMNLANEQQTAIIFALDVPKKWALDTELNERAAADAVFLKIGPETPPGKREFFFAAGRIAWHPDTLLGDVDMDVGLLDTVQQMRPITNDDRECFFQLLAAAGRTPGLEHSNVDSATELAALLKSPAEHLGQLYSFRGVARRAVKIRVTDADTVARFGFDDYYEIVIFLDVDAVVGGQRVRSHPVVYCVRELPPGFPVGENIAEVVRASGFMFKKWPYTTQATESKNPDLRMSSPLLVGKTVVWDTREASTPSMVGPIVGGFLIAVVGAVCGIVWWLGRGERKLRRAASEKRRALPEGQSLDALALELHESGDDRDASSG